MGNQYWPSNLNAGETLRLEKDPSVRLSDTIELPNFPGVFAHIETDRSKLTKAFSEFASLTLGYPQEEAEKFFADKVNVRFGSLQAPPEYFPGVSKLDIYLDRINQLLMGGNYLGLVTPREEGSYYEMLINVNKVQEFLPLVSRVWLGAEYGKSLEAAEIMLPRVLGTIAFHEFIHLTQYMKDPSIVYDAQRNTAYARRVALYFLTASLVANEIVPPEYRMGIVAANTAVIFGCAVYNTMRGMPVIEWEAYKGQNFWMGYRIQNPIKVEYERFTEPARTIV